ncbi:MAG TPA: DUF2934 domain-containing protein [Acidobacteriaceae bacterium]
MEETTKSPKAPAKPRKTAAKKAPAKTPATPEAAPATHKVAAVAAAPASSHTNGAAPRPSVSREEIARLAHKFWAERGHQHGHHVDDWLRAEQELRKKAS